MAATPLLAADILRVAAIAQLGAQVAMNVWHYFVVSATGTPATDQDVINTVDTTIATLYKGIIPSEVTYKGILGGIINRSPNPLPVQSTTGAGAGVTAVEPMPKQAAGITSWYTAFAGPGYRGRTYWPFISSGYQDVNGEITNAGKAAMDAVAGALQGLTSISTGGRTATIALAIYHKKVKLTTPVATRLTRTVVATQKRRGDYGRPNTSPL